MSDAILTVVITGTVTVTVTIVTGLIGFLTLWIKLKYGVEKAEQAANNAERVESKIDDNTAITNKIAKQTNGTMDAATKRLDEHESKIGRLKEAVESIQKSVDVLAKDGATTKYEMRDHFQTLYNKMDILRLTIENKANPKTEATPQPTSK